MGYFSEKQMKLEKTVMDGSYYGFEYQLLWRYESLKDRYLELMSAGAAWVGDDVLTKADYRYAPIGCFKTIRDVWWAMELAKEELATKCDIIVREDGTLKNKDEEGEDPNQITLFEIVLLPTWFQTAMAA